MQRIRRQIFAATWMSYFGYYLCRKTWSVVKADVQRDLGLSTPELANIGTLFLLNYMFGLFLGGALGRKYGAKTLLLLGMGVSICVNVVFGFASSYAALCVLMVLNGLAQGTGWPGNIGMLSQWYEKEERGTVMGWWSTCYSVGAAVAKGFAGSVVALAIAYGLPTRAWSYAYWAAAAAFSLIWLGFARYARDGEAAPASAPSSPPTSASSAYFAVLRDPMVLLIGATYFSFKFLRYAIDSWSPYLFRNMGMSTQLSAWASTGFDWAGIFGMIAVGWVSDRVFKGRRIGPSLISTIGLVAALLIGVFTTGPWMMVIGFTLTGLFLYGPDALLSGAGAADAGRDPKNAVAAAGIVNGLGSLGPVVQEQVMGRLIADDLRAMHLVLVALGCLALVGLVAMRRRDPRF